MNVTDGAAVATILGAPIAIIALIYAARQLRSSAVVSRGQFMLELEQMIAAHDEVYLKLRRGGDWGGTGRGPNTADEWAKVEDYMGFFEHCEILLKDGALAEPGFRALFAYRLDDIVGNRTISDLKLGTEKDGWQLFLALLRRFHVPEPGQPK